MIIMIHPQVSTNFVDALQVLFVYLLYVMLLHNKLQHYYSSYMECMHDSYYTTYCYSDVRLRKRLN
jgi:hypothetical protein